MRSEPRKVVKKFFDRMEDDERRPTVGELFAADGVVTVPGERFEGPDEPEQLPEYFGPPRYQYPVR